MGFGSTHKNSGWAVKEIGKMVSHFGAACRAGLINN